MEFQFSRFRDLLIRDFTLHGKKFLLSIIALVLILFVAVSLSHNLISSKAGGGIQALLLTSFFLLTAGGGFLTASNLGDLNSPSRRIHYIGLPASAFEKILSKWLYTLPLYVLTITFILWIFFEGYIGIYGDEIPESGQRIADKIKSSIYPYFLQIYLIGHGVAFFCSFFFNTFAAVKGALWGFGLIIVIGVLHAIFTNGLDVNFLVHVQQSLWEMLIYVGERPKQFLLLAPLLWIATYFIFKRKSV